MRDASQPQPARTGDGLSVAALVGSAGGIDAVSRVLSRLPADFGAAVVVLIHQSPEHVSRLVPVLRGRGALPIDQARDGTRLRPGTVVVAPPGRHVLVTPASRVALIPSGPFPPSRPSADLLLATLATALGARAIAVILSGGGHDGATGASAVHALGGTVWATDEASSASFAMPLAAIERDRAVDRVLDVDAVAKALTTLVAGRDAHTRA
jgi:two-component system chemotaxis response regulator CheB